MSTITKERVAEFIKNPLNNGLTRGEQMELARIALSSLEAEAVAFVMADDLKDSSIISTPAYRDLGEAMERTVGDVVALYAAPPAPVSAPKVPNSVTAETCSLDELGHDWNDAEYYAQGWNACRAAILQGVDGRPELTVWYGSMPESNGKTNWTAILHRKGEGIQDGMTIDRSEYPGRVLYAADRVRYLIGEKADRPYILDYDTDTHSGYVEPVSQRYKLPEVIDENLVEGLRLLQCMLDDYRERNYGHAHEWIRHIDRKFAEHSESHEDDAYSIFSSLLRGADGNSPVIPDGLRLALSNAGIAAPESDEMLAATCEKYIQEMVTWVKERKPFQPAQLAPDGWVACSERMPESNKYVLVCNGVWVGMGLYNGGEQFEDCERWQDEHGEFIDLLHHPVSHWIPLPEAPQQEGE